MVIKKDKKPLLKLKESEKKWLVRWDYKDWYNHGIALGFVMMFGFVIFGGILNLQSIAFNWIGLKNWFIFLVLLEMVLFCKLYFAIFEYIDKKVDKAIKKDVDRRFER